MLTLYFFSAAWSHSFTRILFFLSLHWTLWLFCFNVTYSFISFFKWLNTTSNWLPFISLINICIPRRKNHWLILRQLLFSTTSYKHPALFIISGFAFIFIFISSKSRLWYCCLSLSFSFAQSLYFRFFLSNGRKITKNWVVWSIKGCLAF